MFEVSPPSLNMLAPPPPRPGCLNDRLSFKQISKTDNQPFSDRRVESQNEMGINRWKQDDGSSSAHHQLKHSQLASFCGEKQ